MRKSKGFTLIELLVVIAIIGILASIVLVSLGSARNKAKDAAIRGSMSEVRNAAELYFDTATNYTGLCADTGVTRLSAAVTTNGGTFTCNAAADAYAAQSTLNGGSYYCVDSNGTAKNSATSVASNTVCP